MKIKNILILAGGDGTRFWPLKKKILTPFLGKPYLRHIIEKVNSVAERIYIVVNQENKEQIKQMNPRFHTVTQKTSEGMAGAVLECKSRLEGETLILGNDLFDYSILKNLIKKDADMVLMAKKVTSYFPGGYLRLSGDKIEGIEEKPDPQKTPSNLVRLVADYFRDVKEFISMIEKIGSLTDIAYEHALNSMIQNKKTTYYEHNGYWYPLKFPWHVLSMMSHFLHTIKKETVGKGTKISKSALVVGPVWIGNNVKIGDFTKIVGPTYVGDNAVIGDHALVRESHVGNSALVGGGSEVARSYIGEKVMLHRNYVGDSVLDQGVLFGSGAATANFRFDAKTIKLAIGDKKVDSNMNKFGAVIGKNSKIGVNSTLLPGVKIGKDTWIGPGEIIKEDIGDNLFVMNGEKRENK